MKAMKKRILAAIATMAVLCMSLTGCGSKLTPADQTIGALFELAAKSNAAPMKDLLGFASEDDVRSSFFEDGADTELVDDLKNQLSGVGVDLSDEDIQELTDSLTTMLDKISYTAEITSEESDKTVVTLKVNGFSSSEMNQVILDAATAMQASITDEDKIAIANGDMDVFSSYMQQYVKDFVTGLAAMEPSSETSEITVTCEKLKVDVSGKEKVAWLPSNMDGFSNDIQSAIFK